MAARHSANVERQRQTDLQVVGVRNRVAAAIVRLCSQIKAAAARVEAGAREVEAATETLALVQARQREGVDLLLHVLDAQAALSRARSRLVVAVSDHNIAQYSLLRAVGGAR
jgi:outer membrane protein TolC